MGAVRKIHPEVHDGRDFDGQVWLGAGRRDGGAVVRGGLCPLRRGQRQALLRGGGQRRQAGAGPTGPAPTRPPPQPRPPEGLGPATGRLPRLPGRAMPPAVAPGEPQAAMGRPRRPRSRPGVTTGSGRCPGARGQAGLSEGGRSRRSAAESGGTAPSSSGSRRCVRRWTSSWRTARPSPSLAAAAVGAAAIVNAGSRAAPPSAACHPRPASRPPRGGVNGRPQICPTRG